MAMSYQWMTCLTAAALASAGVAQAEGTLTVQSGLVSYQTIQCDEGGKATLECAGAADAALQGKKIRARVVQGDKAVLDWADCATPEAGKWTARFDGVPAGGPYRVEVQALDEQNAVATTAAVDHVLVGDLWILAGQSNMQGVGNNVDVEKPSEQVNVFAMNDTWRIAEEPIHRLDESVDVIHSGVQDEAKRKSLVADVSHWTKGAGLGLPFAKEMVKMTGRPVGLVACAHGGTSMAQWDPALRDKGGESLYGSVYRRFLAVGGKVRGVVWYQGESDANQEAGKVFPEKFKQFVEALRTDLKAPELPFYYVQIGRFTNAAEAVDWNKIQEDQRLAEAQVPHTGMVASIDLPLDDGIHIGTDGLKVLGHRVALMAARDLFDASKAQNGPRPASIRRNTTPFGLQLLVTFTGVNGGLTSAGRVSGFSLGDAAGKPLTAVFDQQVSPDDPNTVIVWVNEAPAGSQLWYGRGFDPYCNVVDKEGMAVPVFGPMPVPD